ncbi:MAG TPA: hypothetical protein VGE97_08910 [Nitrososphaera sp.]
MTWSSQQLPTTGYPNESREVREIKFKTRNTYQAPPLRRAGWALYATQRLRTFYGSSPPPVMPSMGRILMLERLNQ